MNLHLDRKLAVDHYIGGPIAWMLNIAAQLLGAILNRDHSLERAPRTILFLKFIGLGSIVRASSLLRAAKDKHPEARMAFAVFPGCAPLVSMYDEVDQVLVVRDRSLVHLVVDTLKLIVWCWRNQVDLVVDLEVHAKYSSIVSALSLARNRAGFAGTTSRFRRGLYTHLVFWNPIRFVDHAYAQLGKSIGLETRDQPPINIPESKKDEADRYLRELGWEPGTLLIGVNPNASDLKTERRWPREHFVSLIESIPTDLRCMILLVGSPAEYSYVQTIASQVKVGSERVFNIAGRVSFGAFVHLLSRLDLFVTNDSGPLHLAREFATPTVSLWGPTHPINYSPRGSGHISLFRPIYCSPCTHASDVPPCGGDNQCLKQISPQRALKAVLRLLKQPIPERQKLALEPRHDLSSCKVLGYWQRASVPLE